MAKNNNGLNCSDDSCKGNAKLFKNNADSQTFSPNSACHHMFTNKNCNDSINFGNNQSFNNKNKNSRHNYGGKKILRR